jgi:CBS domain containing-hemolysin-like protein
MGDVWALGVGFALSALWLVLASAAQAAFAQVNAVRLRQLMQRGVPRAEALAAVAHDPSGLSAAIWLSHLLAITVGVVLALRLTAVLRMDALAATLVVLAAVGILVAAQMLGRAVGIVKPEGVASRLYGLVRVSAWIGAPLVRIDGWLVRAAMRRALGPAASLRLPSSEEDLRALVDAVEETEELEREEREMITNIFEMSDRDVSEIMMPRPDIVPILSTVDINTAIDLAVSSGHSRFPVIEEDIDHVLGIVHLRDLAAAARSVGEPPPLTALVRPVNVVPETKKIDELLHEFQSTHTQMALVVDEYGGTAGIVTIEDLLEEIVGEIRDEYDTEEDPIQLLSEREAIMNATVSIHDANEALPLHLNDEEYDTVAELVYSELGRVPVTGDTVQLDTCSIRVISTAGRRVLRVRVTLQEREPTPPRDGPSDASE